MWSGLTARGLADVGQSAAGAVAATRCDVLLCCCAPLVQMWSLSPFDLLFFLPHAVVRPLDAAAVPPNPILLQTVAHHTKRRFVHGAPFRPDLEEACRPLARLHTTVCHLKLRTDGELRTAQRVLDEFGPARCGFPSLPPSVLCVYCIPVHADGTAQAADGERRIAKSA